MKFSAHIIRPSASVLAALAVVFALNLGAVRADPTPVPTPNPLGPLPLQAGHPQTPVPANPYTGPRRGDPNASHAPSNAPLPRLASGTPLPDPLRTLHYSNRISPASGSFLSPFMLYFDNVNNQLYVSDLGNSRVLVFYADGSAAGTLNTGGAPEGIVVLGSSVFVADCVGNRVLIYDRTTATLTGQFGTGGSGPGQLNCPMQIAYNQLDTLIYVADSGNNRIQKFAVNGTPIGTIGGTGTFSAPQGVAIDWAGYVYVSDSGNNRVQKYTSTGSFVRTIAGPGSVDGQVSYPYQITVDSAGLIWVADANNVRIQKFDWQSGWRGSYSALGGPCAGLFGTTCQGTFGSPRGLAVSGAGKVYVSDALYNTVQSFDAAMQPNIHTFQFARGGLGSNPVQFNGAAGVAMDSAENVYVTDFANNRVQKFDKFGNYLIGWGAPGTGNGQFNGPYGIAIDSNNNIFVADFNNHRIQKFDTNGAWIGGFGSNGSGNGQFAFPVGVAVDSAGFVYVADRDNDRIQKLDGSGGFINKFGTFGSGLGQLNTPLGVAVDNNRGIVYVIDNGNNRLQWFTVFGDPVAVSGDSTSGTCALNNPIELAADQRGNIYVADRDNNRVVQFNTIGNCVSSGNFSGTNFVNAVGISPKNGQLVTASGSTDSFIRFFGSPNPRNDTLGIYRPSNATFFLRNSNTQGVADITVTFGSPGAPNYDMPIVGDWTGNGIDSIGVYRSAEGRFFLRKSNAAGATDLISFYLGIPGDTPLAGDWDGDGADSTGVYRPSNGILFLRNALTTGIADYAMILGIPGDIGVAGDWDGDGVANAGVYRTSQNNFYLSNRNTAGVVFGDYVLLLGIPGDTPFTGDWIHQGSSGLGVFRPSNGFLYLKYGLVGIYADSSFYYGAPNDIPLGGRWGPVPGAFIPPPIQGPSGEHFPPPILVPGPARPTQPPVTAPAGLE